MMRMHLKCHWHVILNCPLDRHDVLARRNPCAIADAEDMRINRLGGKLMPHIQNDIGRLAPHARQRLQSRAGCWHSAVIGIHQNPAQLNDIFGLLPKQPNGFDMFGQTIFAKIQHFLRRIGPFGVGSEAANREKIAFIVL